MGKLHYILDSERLRDMLEHAFVAGINAQREVDDKRPHDPFAVKERLKAGMIAKLLSEPGSLALRWNADKQRWDVV